MKPEDLNLEFWQKVKKEYSTNTWCHICNGSPAFAEAWAYFKTALEIQRLANEFLTSKDMEPNARCDGSLFLSSSHQLRLKFIDWNIQRLSN